MRYEVILTPEALEDFKELRTVDRSKMKGALELYLRFEPRKQSKSRIKRLRGLKQPEYRLRVDHFRIFYDVIDNEVYILAIVPKSNAERWLKNKGVNL